MSLVLTKPDDSPLTGITLTAERGVPSAHVAIKVLNNGAEAVEGAFVVLYAETSPGSGIYSSSGQPVVDELMGRLEITGQDSSATPGQEIVLGVVQPLGHLAVGLLPKILPGDWILADVWIEQGGDSAGGGAINIKIELAGEQTAKPLPYGVSMVGNGIDTGRHGPRSFPIEGLGLTASGPPDSHVHVAAGKWLLAGEEYEDADGDVLTLNQNDGAAAALGSGESYIAVVTASPVGFTVTKGLKGSSPARPIPPTGELILGFVTVLYNGGGSVIQTSDIDQDEFTYGRYRPVAPATGLSVEIHGGDAVISNFGQIRQQKSSVALSPSSLNRVWLEWTGAITVTTSDVPPSAGAVKICTAQTDGSNITVFTDTRRYISVLEAGAGTMTIHTPTNSPTVANVSDLIVPETSLIDHGSGQAELVFPSDSNLIHKDGSVAFTANQSHGGHKITSVADPTSAQDAATKNYVDGAVVGFTLQGKASVRAATTVAKTLATDFENGDTIDGVTLATGDRVLVKNQAAAAENGIYTVNASGAPTRATDADSSGEVKAGMFCFVEEGTVNADTGWLLTTNNPITLGSTGLSFRRFDAPAGSVATGAETKTLSTGSNDNLALSNSGVLFDVVKLSLASGVADLTGIVAPSFAQLVALVDVSSTHAITVKHQSSSSSAGNRIACPSASDIVLDATNKSLLLLYDTESLVWIVVATNFGVAGGGGGGSTTFGAFASRPAGSNGDVYVSTDAPGLKSIKASGAWTDFVRDTKVTLPAMGSWTALNREGGDTEDHSAGFVKLSSLGGTNLIKGFYKAEPNPATNYQIVMRVRPMLRYRDYHMIGLGWCQSGGSKIKWAGILKATGSAWQMVFDKWNSATSYNSSYQRLQADGDFLMGQLMTEWITFRLRNDSAGGFIYFDWSQDDGRNWRNFGGQQTRTDFFTPDRVCLIQSCGGDSAEYAYADWLDWTES